MIRTIRDGGINWNWYLCADFNEEEKTAHIYFYDRWHKYEHRGSYHPKAEPGISFVQMLEDDTRKVYAIELGGIEYLVTNPAGVFTYHDMTHYQEDK